MKIAYLSNSEIPSRAANSVHVMKMCQAFAQNGHRVTLYARKGQAHDGDVYRTYGVSNSFEIRYCGIPFYRSEEHTSELQSLMRISYAVFCLTKNTYRHKHRILTYAKRLLLTTIYRQMNK